MAETFPPRLAFGKPQAESGRPDCNSQSAVGVGGCARRANIHHIDCMILGVGMRRAGSLFDLPDDDLAAIARKASARAVRKLRDAGLTPSGTETAVRNSRKIAGNRPSTTPPRRAKATARGA